MFKYPAPLSKAWAESVLDVARDVLLILQTQSRPNPPVTDTTSNTNAYYNQQLVIVSMTFIDGHCYVAESLNRAQQYDKKQHNCNNTKHGHGIQRHQQEQRHLHSFPKAMRLQIDMLKLKMEEMLKAQVKWQEMQAEATRVRDQTNEQILHMIKHCGTRHSTDGGRQRRIVGRKQQTPKTNKIKPTTANVVTLGTASPRRNELKHCGLDLYRERQHSITGGPYHTMQACLLRQQHLASTQRRHARQSHLFEGKGCAHTGTIPWGDEILGRETTGCVDSCARTSTE